MRITIGKHSFRTAILALVLGSLSLTVGMIGVVAFVNSHRSVEELRQRQYELTSRLMAKEVSRLLEVAPKLLHAQAGLAKRGALNLEDFDGLAVTFAERLRVEPELSWLSYGAAATGRFVGVRRDEQGRLVLNRSDRKMDSGRPREFLVDGDRLAPLDRELPTGYDARKRPWFQEAEKSKEAVWSSIYRWNDGTSGLTLSLAARSPETGEVVGVFTADFTLRAIGDFLRSLTGGSARALILLTTDGQVMGDSSTLGGTTAVTSTLAALPMSPSDLKTDVPVGFAFEYGGNRMIGVARRLEPTPGFACVAVFAAGEQEFFGSVMNNVRSTALLGLCALLSAAAVSFLLAARLARPLAVISEDLKRIARFELQKIGPSPSFVREIAIVGEKRSERMKAGLRSFGRYVPTALVRNLLSKGHDAEIGAEERELTVVFADLAGFTSLSEKLTPSQTVDEMGEFFQLATEAIESHKGTLDKFLGDGLLAFFNAPLDVPDHAVKACLAALEIRDRLAAAEPARAAQGRPQMRIRLGINTGEVLVGNIGTEERFAYTVFGDNANLASRLEGLNKQYGTVILASDAVRRATSQCFAWRQIDRVAVVGRGEATTVHELLGVQAMVTPDQVALREAYEEAMESYYSGSFEEALRRLKHDPHISSE